MILGNKRHVNWMWRCDDEAANGPTVEGVIDHDVCTHVTCCKNRNSFGMRQIKSLFQEFLIQNQHLVQVQSSYENLEFRRGVVKKTDHGFIAHT